VGITFFNFFLAGRGLAVLCKLSSVCRETRDASRGEGAARLGQGKLVLWLALSSGDD